MHVRRISLLGPLALLAGFIGAAEANTLEKIRATQTISLGYREASPPFSYKDADGRPAGYSVELCNRIAAAVKTELDLPELALRYVAVTAENRIERLVSGDIDLECGSTTRTIARQAQVDFTLFTFVTGTELLVQVGSRIDDIGNLVGKTVAVLPGTTTEALIRSALASRSASAAIRPVRDHDEGVAAVVAGTADAYASDEVLLIGLARRSKDPGKLRLTGKLYSYEPYALMLRRDDGALRYVADRTLAQLFRGGEIADIYRRWFGEWGVGPRPMLVNLFLLQSLPE
jgi:glutamate/aspartate transport system substrate-binding protein